MCYVIVNNLPSECKKHIVARLDSGELWYWGSWNEKEKAEKAAMEFDNGVVVEKRENGV